MALVWFATRTPGLENGPSARGICERHYAGGALRAIQITELTGPPTALQAVDLPEPTAKHMMTPGGGVLIEVRAAGVSFPELLQTRGQYQIKPDLSFVLAALESREALSKVVLTVG